LITLQPCIKGVWIPPQIAVEEGVHDEARERATLIMLDFFYWGIKQQKESKIGSNKITIGAQMIILDFSS
jgi:hypothetical protein